MFGRFVPDFGRVVAQMQFDMYHHYTVDEHSIRAIGLLPRSSAASWPTTIRCRPPCSSRSRRAASLYVAVLLHDIAKGRGGDHSVLGAEIALELCPRFGLDEAETETVAWLVRYHLLLSNTAFRRDLADPKTIEDFVAHGAKPGAAAPAADPDRGRYPRGRSGHLERLEAAAAAHLVRCRRGAAAARPQAARPAPSRSRRASSSSPTALPLEGVGRARPCPAPARQLLAGRAARMADRQCAAGRGGRGAYRRSRAMRRRRRARSEVAARPGSASSRPTGRACSTASAPGSRRPAPRSSMRASTPRATAWRSTICSSPTRSGRAYADRRLRSRLVRCGRSGASGDASRPLPEAGRRCRAASGVSRRAIGR